MALRDALRPIAARHGVSVAAVAIAWTLSWRGVSGAIVGARSPQQVDGWIAAGSLTLEAADLAEIGSALERTQGGVGPTHPAGSPHDAHSIGSSTGSIPLPWKGRSRG